MKIEKMYEEKNCLRLISIRESEEKENTQHTLINNYIIIIIFY